MYRPFFNICFRITNFKAVEMSQVKIVHYWLKPDSYLKSPLSLVVDAHDFLFFVFHFWMTFFKTELKSNFKLKQGKDHLLVQLQLSLIVNEYFQSILLFILGSLTYDTVLILRMFV